MRRALLIMVLFGGLGMTHLQAQNNLGIGGFWGLNLLEVATQGPGVTIALPRANPFFPQPLVLGVGFPVIGTRVFNLGFTLDFWAINQVLVNFVNVYVGPGLFLNVTAAGGTTAFNFGGRVPVGINIKPLRWFELFLEVAPAVGVVIADPITAQFLLQGSFGLRFWF